MGVNMEYQVFNTQCVFVHEHLGPHRLDNKDGLLLLVEGKRDQHKTDRLAAGIYHAIQAGGFNLTRFEQSRDKVSKVLDEEEFQGSWNQGRAMTMDQAVALALEIK
jgi:hypothetical protein